MIPMNAKPEHMSDPQTISKADNSSIDSLSSEIARLRRYADWWNNGYLLLGFSVVVVAGLAAVFQYTAVKEARQLADREADLSRTKESRLNQDLKDKDVQIRQLEERQKPSSRMRPQQSRHPRRR